jgi:hypothetical protein
MTNDDTKKRSWEIIVLRTLGLGVGMGVGLGIVLAIWVHEADKPKKRDKDSLVVRRVFVTGVTMHKIPDASPDPTDTTAAWLITIDLENLTGRDTVFPGPDGYVFMKSAKSGGELSDYDVTPPRNAFLPAHHTRQVEFIGNSLCSVSTEHKEKDFQTCFEHNLKPFNLVVFDKEGKYEISIPIPDHAD